MREACPPVSWWHPRPFCLGFKGASTLWHDHTAFPIPAPLSSKLFAGVGNFRSSAVTGSAQAPHPGQAPAPPIESWRFDSPANQIDDDVTPDHVAWLASALKVVGSMRNLKLGRGVTLWQSKIFECQFRLQGGRRLCAIPLA